MADLDLKILTEIAADRATQAGAQPTQPLDSTTIFLANIKGWRDADTTPTDLNTTINDSLL